MSLRSRRASATVNTESSPPAHHHHRWSFFRRTHDAIFGTSVAVPQAVEAQQHSPPSARQKPCGHGCRRVGGAQCCACSDQSMQRFMLYADEEDQTSTYCLHCRAHPSTALPFTLLNQSTTRSNTVTQSPSLANLDSKACGHTGCQLSTPIGCCGCLDRRPFMPGGYMHYVDGEGWRSGGSREDTYCPHCRVHPSWPSSWPSASPTPSSHSESEEIYESDTTGSESAVSFASSASLLPSSSASHRKQCGHDYCELSIALCCACSDRRPHTASYSVYIDGQGNTWDGTRHQSYCSTCREIGPVLPREPATRVEVSSIHNRISLQPEPFHLEAENPPTTAKPEQAAPHAATLSFPFSPSDTLSDLCKICFDAPLDTLFLPCAHLVSCTACAALIFSGSSDIPSNPSRRGEISGRDLLAQASYHALGGGLDYSALTQLRPGKGRSEEAKCPMCRHDVTRWLRVYKS